MGYVRSYPLDTTPRTPPSWSAVRSRSVVETSHGWKLRAVGEDARGWPWRSLVAYAEPESASRGVFHDSTQLKWGFVARGTYHDDLLSAGGRAVIIPLRPIWTGIVFGSILYFVPYWLLFTASRCWIAYAHLLNHRCWQCGYPTIQEGQSICPECGRLYGPIGPMSDGVFVSG